MRWALMMIRLAAACRNTSVRRTTGTAPEPMMSQHLPGSDGWQLVDISDDQQRCMVRDCFHKRLHTMAADTEEPSSVASRFESPQLHEDKGSSRTHTCGDASRLPSPLRFDLAWHLDARCGLQWERAVDYESFIFSDRIAYGISMRSRPLLLEDILS
jgi:hypothetical protein